MEYEQLSFIEADEFKETKKFKPLLTDKQRSKKVISLIPSDKKKIPSGFNWCPYCVTTVKLVKDKRLGISRCPLCGISNKDYYMKKANFKK